MWYYLLHASITKLLPYTESKTIERTRMTTKIKKKNITMMLLCLHLMKRKKKAAMVKMRMIKNANLK